MEDREFQIVKLKAEIFDLQVQMGETKQKLEEKIRQLNSILKDEANDRQPGQT